MILLSAQLEFLERILSYPALGCLVTEGLLVICGLARRDHLHYHVAVWDAIVADLSRTGLTLPGRQTLV
jgi:hypothetical protein